MYDAIAALHRHLDGIVWALLPGTCILCNAPSGVMADLCEPCRAALPWLPRPCHRCASPLPDGAEQPCADCRTRSPPFTRTVAAFIYTGPIIRMAHRLKFNGSRVDARVIGAQLASCVLGQYPPRATPDLVVPVPLSRERLLRRGHNQAALLARWVASGVGIPVDYHACIRIRHAPPQTGLSRHARLRNLADAFCISRPLPAQTVAIVDDVMTTGSTVTALTRALLDAGAAEVHVWAAARTPPPGWPCAIHPVSVGTERPARELE